MRFLHSADWHLGRQFHNVSLLADQAHALDQFVALAAESQVDAVVIAGDVYDRALPPADAVRLLDDLLERLVAGARLPVVMIAGNHDSGDRLGFGARAMAAGGLHVFGPVASAAAPLALADGHGEVWFCPLPYADPAEVRLQLDEEGVHTHDAAQRALAKRQLAALPVGARSVAVAHCWVAGGTVSESERPLSVGGTGEVGANHFDGFGYTALGHLHRPQSVGENIRYSGSLLKYSFSEASHRKSVSLVEMDAAGATRVEPIALTPRRDVRVVEGALAELLRGPAAGESAEDYLLVRLSDRQAILDPIGKLRQVYPNVLHLERPGLQGGRSAERAAGEWLARSELELFKAFHEEVAGGGLGPGGEEAFLEVVRELRKAGREGEA